MLQDDVSQALVERLRFESKYDKATTSQYRQQRRYLMRRRNFVFLELDIVSFITFPNSYICFCNLL